jgi:hypothetical protein
MGIRAGFSFGERQTFVGTRLTARALGTSGADGRRESSLPHTRCCENKITLRPRLATQFKG